MIGSLHWRIRCPTSQAAGPTESGGGRPARVRRPSLRRSRARWRQGGRGATAGAAVDGTRRHHAPPRAESQSTQREAPLLGSRRRRRRWGVRLRLRSSARTAASPDTPGLRLEPQPSAPRTGHGPGAASTWAASAAAMSGHHGIPAPAWWRQALVGCGVLSALDRQSPMKIGVLNIRVGVNLRTKAPTTITLTLTLTLSQPARPVKQHRDEGDRLAQWPCRSCLLP